MKTLIRKELRENLKPAALGLLVFIILTVGSYRYYAGMIEDAAAGLRNASGYSYRLQPLTASITLTQAALLCAVFGAFLGWVQIQHERHRDLWAFLIHRPVDKTTIYFSKVTGGLSLYLVAAGLPLAGYILWAATPGHVAAPFQPEMIWPFFTAFLGGVAFYFAGMLTSLRQARWFFGRGFGLGMALLVCLTGMQATWPFWQILAIMLLGILILAIAAWGSFISHGQYQGQPAFGKVMLTASLLPGAVAVVFIVACFLVNLLPLSFRNGAWSTYHMAKDGTLYRESRGGSQPPSIVDLDGRPFTDPQTGNKVLPIDFGPYASTPLYDDVDPEGRRPKDDYPRTYFNFWRQDQGSLWFYWAGCGRLVGYNLTSRRLIVSLGPKGFASDLRGAGDRFDTPTQYQNFLISEVTLATATTLYKIDTQNRAVRPLFTVENDDSILSRMDVQPYSREWDSDIVVATKRFVYLVRTDGSVVWQAPYEPGYPDYKRVQIYFLKEPGHFAYWLEPTIAANRKAGWTLTIRARWIDHDGGVVKTVDLPNLSAKQGPDRTDKLLALVVPAPLWRVFYWRMDRDWSWVVPWELVGISLASAAIIWIPLGWRLGRRYNFTIGQQLGWAVFHLVFNLPGFLTFIGVQEWPARVPCTKCHKLRG